MTRLPLLLLSLLLVSSAYGQVIKHEGYTAYYNQQTLIPDSVVYVAKPHAKGVSRKGIVFHAATGEKNLTRDYKGSSYDIGHQADFSDEDSCQLTGYQSFEFSNAVPQRPNLNRKVWLALENYVRELKHPVKVKVSWRGTLGTIGVDRVVIPAVCIKEIWYSGHYERYEMPNADSVIKHPFIYYRVK